MSQWFHPPRWLSLTALVAVAGSPAASACGTRTAPSDGRDGDVPRDARPRDGATPEDDARVPRDAMTPPPPPLRDGGVLECATPCDDGLLCNGIETCDLRTGLCVPGEQDPCDDGVECTIDVCDPVGDVCVNTPMARDADGDGVGACAGDCDDENPRVFPGAAEACDSIDNDCDSEVDEGLISECGDCRLGCVRTTAPNETTMVWQLDPESSSGVMLDPTGAVTLSSSRTETYFAWIANTGDGTITKLDTRTGAQVAEYDSVLVDGVNHARPPNERCLTDEQGGNCPSRTAVDLRGNMFVANRAFQSQGTVTKIANFPEDCIDRNGDGTIQTSQDVDGDGVIESDVPGEVLGQRDECILWTVDVGADGGVPRAIAVAGDGTVWVGLNQSSQVIQLDPETGTALRTIGRLRIRGFAPYGAAVDRTGQMWMAEAGTGRILSIDTATGDVGEIEEAPADGCAPGYGIAVDASDRVWLAGFLCEAVYRFDGRWTTIPLPDSGVTRGVAVGREGNVYFASSHEWIRILPRGGFDASEPISRLTIIEGGDPDRVRVLNGLPGLSSIGVGLDSSGFVWTVNQDSGTATRIDVATGAATDYAVGSEPYTYSDFTGYALRTITSPNGYVRAVIEGCSVGPTEWEQLWWDAETPAGARVEVRARTSDSREGLRTATWTGPWTASPVDLSMRPGPLPTLRFLEVEVTLVSEDEVNSPIVRNVTVQHNCPF
ncbi:MAG: hypothetical protein IT379_04285 [Deltaproteobacteria bacterium]|nr:hypothetical protein [Deltaproteobacteria bacterium]